MGLRSNVTHLGERQGFFLDKSVCVWGGAFQVLGSHWVTN